MKEEQDHIPTREYALVEIYGHRRHYAEISDVERVGAKFLRVHDADTDEVHFYGAAAIFSLTILSPTQMEAHIAAMRAEAERQARWKAEAEERRAARLLTAFPFPATENWREDESPENHLEDKA